ncbi:hypothetical protein LAZ67_20001650 [Cordylochernes scorpioides]|uniref:Reverse transcriptase domain-containing protein n=1 Tax=Cordylochernes scorpioides TaxID=51811 RepID=A0ABY6LK47_9ARAC|nr:hypothetical protein LAZ67_20001650 [Cordylochernes scorpioides]
MSRDERILQRKLSCQIRRIDGFIESVDSIIEADETIRLEIMGEELKEIKEKIEKLYDELFSLDEVDIDKESEAYDGSMNKIGSLRVKIENERKLIDKLADIKPNGSQANIKLPQFDLPIYDGDMGKWINFKELFLTTIDAHPGFRTYPVAITADIEKMYRQIRIHPEDADYQRILWRPSPEEPVVDYRLLTVTYGTTSAPFLAMRTLQQLAEDEGHNYPEASRVTLNDFYVDDLLTGAQTIAETKELIDQLKDLMKKGGFHLRKWNSNCQEIVSHVEEMNEERKINLEKGAISKILGIVWDHVQDTFRVNITLPEEVVTKRDLLSNIARIFDPLGFLSPTRVAMANLQRQTAVKEVEDLEGLPVYHRAILKENGEWPEVTKAIQCSYPKVFVGDGTHLYLLIEDVESLDGPNVRSWEQHFCNLYNYRLQTDSWGCYTTIPILGEKEGYPKNINHFTIVQDWSKQWTELPTYVKYRDSQYTAVALDLVFILGPADKEHETAEKYLSFFKTRRSQHCTTDQLFYFCQSIIDSFQDKPPKKTTAIFLDMTSAFDRVWREKLRKKLHNIGNYQKTKHSEKAMWNKLGSKTQNSQNNIYHLNKADNGICNTGLGSLKLITKNPPFSENEVKLTAFKFGKRKSPGPEGIDNTVVKALVRMHPSLLSRLFNRCLDTGTFPEAWKVARVVLLEKSGKVLDSLLAQRLKHWLESNELLSSFQHGFREGKSTTTALNEVLEGVEMGLNKGAWVLFVALDIDGAFNSMNWNKLMRNLMDMGCPDNLCSLVRDFLRDRRISLSFGGRKLERNCARGCPQGSCCGPILWNILVNTVFQEELPEGARLVLYADDHRAGCDQGSPQSVCQEELQPGPPLFRLYVGPRRHQSGERATRASNNPGAGDDDAGSGAPLV